jgi:hypothetical protein
LKCVCIDIYGPQTNDMAAIGKFSYIFLVAKNEKEREQKQMK